ncbi:hypothetical protein DKX38_010019 [Salix brachista]|uniref:Uncharacterized protein n=1 Tax=Salix brachista TaxID=2182728 RepID=A0A5N5MCA7_9ROSI|nr:hypothetical protein DKX38_010019 [Salix brachista]
MLHANNITGRLWAEAMKIAAFVINKFPLQKNVVFDESWRSTEQETLPDLKGFKDELQSTRIQMEMMEIEEEAVEKLCIQVGLEPVGSANEKYIGEGRSIIEQGTEDTNVDMEETIPLQVENHEILISSCDKPSRNTLDSCEEPAREKRFLSSCASKLIIEESPKEMVVFGSSCITSGSEKESSSEESLKEKLKIEIKHWMDAKSKWISLVEELRAELDASTALAEKLK